MRSPPRYLPGLAVVLLACGGAPPRPSLEGRRDLEAAGLEDARAAAPDLVGRAEAALRDAEAAEAEGDVAAARDHVTLARLAADAALLERERISSDEQRASLEREALALLEQAHADDEAAARVELEARRLAGARAAREELLRSLERAEVEEQRPTRRHRLTLDDAQAMRTAARSLRERTRMLLAAASSLGAPASALADADALVARSVEATDAAESLRLADRAHDASRRALGVARASSPPSTERIASLLEAASADGLVARREERGVVIELANPFARGSDRLEPAALRRVQRLAALLDAYPDGGVLIELDATTGDEALGRRRAAAFAAALARPARIGDRAPILFDTRGVPHPGDRVRVVLVAYADPALTTAPVLGTDVTSPEAPTSGAESTPRESDP